MSSLTIIVDASGFVTRVLLQSSEDLFRDGGRGREVVTLRHETVLVGGVSGNNELVSYKYSP